MSPTWYEERTEPEETYRGKLVTRVPVISPGGRTRLLYELEIGDEAPLAIYAPEIEETLERLTDRDVELVGKLVDLSSEGFGVELWLAPKALAD